MIAAVSLQQVADRCSGVLHGENVTFNSVSIDTRTLQQGDLYVALSGDRFDGHSFLKDAASKGCCAAVVERDEHVVTSQLCTPDTRRALGEIAAINRGMYQGKLVAITGSAGKTTCKNMLQSIFSAHAETCVTQGNLNNEIGVPLTLLQLRAKHKFAVIEMGARKPGDIAYLGQFVQPDIAVLLNAGSAHIEVFGSYQNIVNTKGEIFDALPESGCGVVNLDDPAAESWVKRLGEKRYMCFSMQAQRGDVWVEDVHLGAAFTECMVCTANERSHLRLNAPGEASLSNALAATSAALLAGLSLDDITSALAQYAATEGRLQRRNLAGGTVVIDDSYNANPVSMKAALDVLSLQPERKIAVLGEMAELGHHGLKSHQEVAEYARQRGIDQVFVIGPFAREMAAIVGPAASLAENEQALWEALKSNLRGDEVVLVKGSRCARLDRIVDRLVEEFH